MRFYCPKCRKEFVAVGDDIRTEFGVSQLYHWSKCRCGVHCDEVSVRALRLRFKERFEPNSQEERTEKDAGLEGQ